MMIDRIAKAMADYRVWLWQGRFLMVVIFVQAMSGKDFVLPFVASAMAYGLAGYLKDRK